MPAKDRRDTGQDPIATLIRGARARRGLSLQALGRRVAASAPHLYNIEAGRKLPGEALAARIAEELEFDPDAFRAWVRAAGRSDWRQARQAGIVLERFVRDPRISSLMEEAGVDVAAALGEPERPEDSAGATIREARVRPRDVRAGPLASAAATAALPRLVAAGPRPARVLVPIVDPGADPGAERTPWSRRAALRLDPAELGGFPDLERPFAYALAPCRFPRAGSALPESGYAVLTRHAGWPPDPAAIYAVRHGGRIELAPVLWNGTHLLVLPTPGRSDFVALHAERGHAPDAALCGRVVLVAE